MQPQLVSVPRPDSALVALRYTDAEKTSLHLRSIVTLLFMYGSAIYAGRAYSPLALALAFVINMFGIVRYTGYIHALNHAYRSSDKLPWLLSLMPAVLSPFVLDFAGFRRIHHAHHILETHEGDPDNFLISGNSRLLIFLKCSITFEHWFFFTLRHGWETKRFWLGYSLRLVLFAALAYACGPLAFVVGFLLPIKLGTGMAFYIFSYLSHVHQGERGVFLLPLPPALTAMSHLAIGRNAALPANIHTVHHERPWISCSRLDEAQRLLSSPSVPAPAPAASSLAV